MKIIVGLGNPGEEYRDTPHNLGFAALDALAEALGFNFKFDKKFNAEIGKTHVGSEEIIFARPQTFMNLSGEAVAAVVNFYKIKETLKAERPEEQGFTSTLLVIHDDIDLPLGAMRLSYGVGPAGHKGVISIIEKLGTKNFARLRLGINPGAELLEKIPIENYVLKKFDEADKKIISPRFADLSKILEIIERESLAKAMSVYN